MFNKTDTFKHTPKLIRRPVVNNKDLPNIVLLKKPELGITSYEPKSMSSDNFSPKSSGHRQMKAKKPSQPQASNRH